ncbi:hypothetical protein DM860_007092 [Cuscuta australis]|uniref:Uncharacterized protein n=1 Tax=Cuscuta australis TaxID=267555 RepID=A0A328E779_9ASTE|nr:hypothetical protein DM860_007092 [Cuscuta australis]
MVVAATTQRVSSALVAGLPRCTFDPAAGDVTDSCVVCLEEIDLGEELPMFQPNPRKEKCKARSQTWYEPEKGSTSLYLRHGESIRRRSGAGMNWTSEKNKYLRGVSGERDEQAARLLVGLPEVQRGARGGCRRGGGFFEEEGGGRRFLCVGDLGMLGENKWGSI